MARTQRCRARPIYLPSQPDTRRGDWRVLDAWQKLGRFIGSHMPFIVPLCVATGVLFPDQIGPVKTIVPTLFAFMTFQGALNNTLEQLVQVFRKPLTLIAVLTTTLVVMPTLAFLLASLLFGGNINIVTGIVLAYSVPVGIVSFMWIGMFSGNGPLGLAIILISTVISPVSIPLTLKVLLGQTIQVDVMGMFTDMVFMIALPALAGMLLNDFTHGWGHSKLSPATAPLSKILLIVIIASNATGASPYVLHMNGERVLAMLFVLLFTTSGFVWGLLLSRVLGSSREDSVTLAFDCGLRNISSGTVIATQYFPGEVVFPVMCGTLFQQMLAAFFGRAVGYVVDEREKKRAEA